MLQRTMEQGTKRRNCQISLYRPLKAYHYLCYVQDYSSIILNLFCLKQKKTFRSIFIFFLFDIYYLFRLRKSLGLSILQRFFRQITNTSRQTTNTFSTNSQHFSTTNQQFWHYRNTGLSRSDPKQTVFDKSPTL